MNIDQFGVNQNRWIEGAPCFILNLKSQALDEKCIVLKNKGHFMFSRFFRYILRQTQTKILQMSLQWIYTVVWIIYDLSVQHFSPISFRWLEQNTLKI